jgi:hypothetical protein
MVDFSIPQCIVQLAPVWSNETLKFSVALRLSASRTVAMATTSESSLLKPTV